MLSRTWVAATLHDYTLRLTEVTFGSCSNRLITRLRVGSPGTEIERRDGIHAYIEEPAHRASQTRESAGSPEAVTEPIVEQTPRNLHPPGSAKKRMELDANKVLRRLEKQFRTLLGEKIALNNAEEDSAIADAGFLERRYLATRPIALTNHGACRW